MRERQHVPKYVRRGRVARIEQHQIGFIMLGALRRYRRELYVWHHARRASLEIYRHHYYFYYRP